jgi:hypothetical protein
VIRTGDRDEPPERTHAMGLVYAAGILLPIPLIIIATLLSHR